MNNVHKSRSNNSQQKSLTSICDQHHSLRAQIASLSFANSSVMNFHDHILLLLDYIQILGLFLLFSINFRNPQETILPQVVSTTTHLLNSVSWITFDKIMTNEIVILSVIGVFTLFKYLLFVYVILVAKGKVTSFKPLVQFWRYIFRTQGRVIYFFVSSFWLKAANVIYLTKEDRTGSDYYCLMIFFSFLMGLEFAFSLYLNIFFVDILPSKQFLAAKDNIVEIICLVQKLVLQILAICLDFTEISNLWLFSSVNLAIDILRNLYYFKTLPFYSFKALFYQASLMMIVSSLNISCIITALVRSIGIESSSLIFTMILWIILALLFIYASRISITREFWNIVLNPSIDSPNKLVHRINAIVELREMTKLHFEHNEKYSWTLLANQSINSRIQDILKVEDNEETPLNINNKEEFNRIVRIYLQRLMEIYPKNKFLKLYTAHFYVNEMKLIRGPIDILTKLQKNSGIHISLNTGLLLMEIQNNQNHRYSNPNESYLNLTKFINEKTLEIQAREKIISQADLQIKISNEMQKESPNLSQIFNDSQKLAFHRKNTNKFIKDTINLLSDHHIKPLLLFARYHLVLNHSMNDHTNYTKLYSKKLQKYHKYFEQESLIPENMFQQDVSFSVFSNKEQSIGKVFYASKQFAKTMGRNTDAIMAMNILNNSPPCLRESYLDYHKLIAKQGETIIQNTIQRGFVCTGEGYLLEIDFYVNIHPFVTSEFYMNFLHKTVKSSNKEYMYILENGNIDSTTKGIALKLGLIPSRKSSSPGTDSNLRDISQELVDINNAFNEVFLDPSSASKQAQEIHSLCSNSGKDVMMRSVGNQGKKFKEDAFLYNCQVTNVSLGKSLIKLFTFEEKFCDIKTPPLARNESASTNTNSKETENSRIDQNSPNKLLDQTFADQFPDEKNNGWIDFSAMNSKIEPHSSSLGTQRTVSLMTTQRLQDTSRHFLLTTKPAESPPKIKQSPAKPPVPAESTGGKNLPQTENNRRIALAQSVATSKWSKFSQQKRVFYLYEISLNTKYYPKLYKILFGLFILAFAYVIVSRLVLKLILDDNVENLKASKEILRSAQLRNFQQTVIESAVRMLWELYSGRLAPSSFGSLATLIPILPYLINVYLTQLGDTNQDLLQNVVTLGDDIRQQVFMKDVKIYDTNYTEDTEIDITMDNFQAVNRIVEAGVRFTGLQDLGNQEAQDLMNFLITNSLNGLLIKNEEISKSILSALSSQRETIERNNTIFLIILIVTLMGFVAVTIVIFYQQYLKQMRNLSAFCRISPIKLHETLDEFLRFKRDIEQEENISAFSPSFFKKSQHTKAVQEKTPQKTPNTWDLRKFYYLLVTRFTLMILVVIVVITVSSILNQKGIKSSQTTQEQIYILDHTRSRLTVAYGAFIELTATNNTAEIEEKIVLDELEDLLTELDNVRVSIYTNLLSNNKENSEYIDTMLYGDACPLIGSNEGICNLLESRGYKPGLVYILSSFCSSGRALIQAYKDSDKMEESLKELEVRFFEEPTLLQIVARDEMTNLSTLINEKFNKDLDSTSHQRNSIYIGIVSLVVVVNFLVWRTVLREFRQSINEFKNVLAVLPGEVVLSSFILRTFLMKTSKGVLDPIKNDL